MMYDMAGFSESDGCLEDLVYDPQTCGFDDSAGCYDLMGCGQNVMAKGFWVIFTLIIVRPAQPLHWHRARRLRRELVPGVLLALTRAQGAVPLALAGVRPGRGALHHRERAREVRHAAAAPDGVRDCAADPALRGEADDHPAAAADLRHLRGHARALQRRRVRLCEARVPDGEGEVRGGVRGVGHGHTG